MVACRCVFKSQLHIAEGTLSYACPASLGRRSFFVNCTILQHNYNEAPPLFAFYCFVLLQ